MLKILPAEAQKDHQNKQHMGIYEYYILRIECNHDQQ